MVGVMTTPLVFKGGHSDGGARAVNTLCDCLQSLLILLYPLID